MKKILFFLVLLIIPVSLTFAQETEQEVGKTAAKSSSTNSITIEQNSTAVGTDEYVVEGVKIPEFDMEQSGYYISVDIKYDLSDLKVRRNRAVLLTPHYVNTEVDSVDLTSVGIYTRRRYYYYVRNFDEMITGEDEISFRKAKKPDTLGFHEVLPYSLWMADADMYLMRRVYGCCGREKEEEEGILAKLESFTPEFIYVCPPAEQKEFVLEGRAYIDFPVDKTEIYPDYHRNDLELKKIRASIDSVYGDKDITINTIYLKGFASPEGTYEHNTYLAKERTESIKRYIQERYKFDESLIKTSYRPEDWEGLRDAVEKSNLANRVAILSIIDSRLNPDDKEAKIKREYPHDYQTLLKDVYPYLRHIEYRINYTTREYLNVDEIREVMYSAPQKLSLNEFFLLAGSCDPGSEEFNDVFETAVRMYPEDEVANLNAANIEMSNGNLHAAERYLAKAGDSAEAAYARGIYAYLTGDVEAAVEFMREAETLGLEEATEVLSHIAPEE